MFPSDSILVAPRGEGEERDDLTANERTILDLLGNIMSLRDIIAQGQMPLFEVYEALRGLRDKKLITTRDDSTAQTARGPSESARASSRRRMGNPLPVIAALGVLAASAAVGFRVPIRSVLAGEKPALSLSVRADDGAERRRVEEHLRWTIEAYRARTGKWPARLEDLQADGLLSRDTLRRVESLGIRYRLTPARTAYTLL